MQKAPKTQNTSPPRRTARQYKSRDVIVLSLPVEPQNPKPIFKCLNWRTSRHRKVRGSILRASEWSVASDREGSRPAALSRLEAAGLNGDPAHSGADVRLRDAAEQKRLVARSTIKVPRG